MSKPKLRAEFLLDDQNKPIFALAGGKKHYRISLTVVDTPPETYSVAYQLDETYRVPKRIVTKNVPNFKECITSYGDYVIDVAVLTKDLPASPSLISDTLHRALQKTYLHNTSPEILVALNDISAN